MMARLEQPGTFPKPGPIGRAVRLVLGVVLLLSAYSAAYRVYAGTPTLSTSTDDPTFWLAAALSVYLLRDVIDGGFGQWWGRWVQAAVLVLAVAAAGIDVPLSESVWEPALSWLVNGLMVVVLGYLGINLLVQALVATPGCEVRAIPHLIGRLRGQATTEYRCLVFSVLDAWEARLWTRGRVDERSSGHR
jgi:hypothetical protein